MARMLPEPTISIGVLSAMAVRMASLTPPWSSGLNSLTWSEPRNVGERHLAAMDVHAPELGAAMQHREHLAGVEQAFGIERAFQALLMRKVDLGEHLAHEVALLDADAVLAGQHTAHTDAQPQNVGSEGLGAVELLLLAGIEQDQRMEVAVARMEDIGAGKAVFGGEIRHGAKDCGQVPARDRAVHAEIVRRYPPDCR